ncbi:DUF1758 domain-containing protein [Trichonephila clavipes]|uniref:DUF1758 domain-containing protein n=1 Tax=Trichonephila clavipes TaxID=2585209 RepID=A0A8X6SA33_TRICX|nr:DUF1758 domain-containing protein [Trichonephila clavipes]
MGSKMEFPTGRLVVNNLQTTTARQICTGEVALMTLWVRIAGIKQHKNVRVLLDCGSQRSYISESLAAQLGLRIISKKNVALTLFGGSRTEPKLHNKYWVRQLKGELTAVCTKLGWVVCGASDEIICDKDRTAPTLYTTLAVRDFNISDLWSLEAIGILDANQNLSNTAEKEIARDQFLSSLTRKENSYCVELPWLGSSVELPSNYQVAEKRWFGITRGIRSLRKYEEYDGSFQEMVEGGGRLPSLYDCLVKGPNLIEEIPLILLRFREKCIGVSSDIQHAFLQIELQKEDRDFLRYLWWERDNVVKVLRHTRVVFGFFESGWRSGPDGLKDPEDKWPKLEIKPDEILVLSERRKGINLNVDLGVTAGIDGVKCQSFPETGDSINGLLTVQDQSSLRRVKTKIIEQDDYYAFHYTIPLPSRHHILNCLIRDYHLRHGHKDWELKVGDIVLVGCENRKRELTHRSCSRAFYWQRWGCSSGEGEDQKWHIDLCSEKTESSGGKWSLLIWLNGGVPTYLWNLHQCRVDTLIDLGVEGLSQMCGKIGTPTDQARRRFVEWAQNEIAVVPDFHKQILFSDEAHFWLNGYVNKQNCRNWSEANPQVYVETPLHPEKLTFLVHFMGWWNHWSVLLQKR